jgi:hypothetical protein
MTRKSLTQRQAQMKYGFRSGLEEKTADQLQANNISYGYETLKLPWVRPAVDRKYTPDFILTKADGTNLVIETKGRFVLEDRQKMVHIKNQYPDMDIRFVFSNAHAKLRKGAKTSYAQWCEKEGFLYADKTIPVEWLSDIQRVEEE